MPKGSQACKACGYRLSDAYYQRAGGFIDGVCGLCSAFSVRGK